MQNLKANEIIHISESVLRTLIQNRITTILEFLQEDVSKLSAITKLDLPQVLAARSEMFEKFSAPVRNGTSLLKTKKKFLRTGIDSIDTMLEGGIPIGYLTEICGLANTGKTQLCFQMAMNCAKGKDINTILYIDTKGDFSAIRLQKVLDESGFSHKEMAQIMYTIKVVRVWTIEEAIELLQQLKNKSIHIDNLALIILDSLPCLMFQFLGDESKIGLSMLNTLANYSRYLCRELQICMICVNILTRWLDHDAANLDADGDASSTVKDSCIEKRIRCLGKYWQQIPNLVLLLENNSDNISEVVLSVMKCSSLKIESRKCTLQISSIGVK